MSQDTAKCTRVRGGDGRSKITPSNVSQCVAQRPATLAWKWLLKVSSRALSQIYEVSNSEAEPNNLHTSPLKLPGKFENHWYHRGGRKMRLRSEAKDRVGYILKAVCSRWRLGDS